MGSELFEVLGQNIEAGDLRLSGDGVHKGEFEERGEDEEGAGQEPDVQELDVVDFGQLVRACVVRQGDEG